MSTNMCSDILLLMLVPKDRIASITYLAHDQVEVLMPGADAGVAINHGSAEEVVAQHPDLILASPWSASAMRRLAGKVRAPLIEIEAANSFDDIRRITRQVGRAVGEPGRAEVLIAEMDAKLALLDRDRPTRPIEVAAWSSGDTVPGAGTLTDEIIRRAGAVNLARRMPDASYSTFGVEELLAARPDAIMRGEDRYDGPALRDAVSEHPAIRKAYAGRRISYPASLYACGLPQSADAALQLRAALAKVPQGGVRW
ncbi:ABC transporter substrate-binding protein [Croceibacterium sp. LX-88]|jgi:iron complex transport system substrate-binding protein|uniref:ABC transporter substrate-binding protein n=1 Tax=Croceibacterium selenioxidans TaxID=2838833 RepID=A0ABS5W1X9_9SPHN|nr:ABC transporter substrate-binding protein [Croceibacterium selenioxidans]MBT2133122.1 ABC transporter substrate-binding protein [Croceibacterium selenioxidans]